MLRTEVGSSREMWAYCTLKGKMSRSLRTKCKGRLYFWEPSMRASERANELTSQASENFLVNPSSNQLAIDSVLCNLFGILVYKL